MELLVDPRTDRDLLAGGTIRLRHESLHDRLEKPRFLGGEKANRRHVLDALPHHRACLRVPIRPRPSGEHIVARIACAQRGIAASIVPARRVSPGIHLLLRLAAHARSPSASKAMTANPA